MKKPGRIDAIIPARGGSKGLLRKNILPLAGKPLIAHTIEAALECPAVTRCIVSTDDAEIRDISLKWGAEVIERSPALATDTALVQGAVGQVLEVLESRGDFPEYFALLQPTSPLRTAEQILDCAIRFFDSETSCAISVTAVKQHPYKSFMGEGEHLIPLFGRDCLQLPRQLLPAVYAQNGAIYLMPSRLFREQGSFYAEPALAYVMDPECSVDIDSPLDLMWAEWLLDRKH